MPDHIWIKVADKVQGPFSSSQVRELLDAGKLSPIHQVSSDQQHWRLVAKAFSDAFASQPATDEPGSHLSVVAKCVCGATYHLPPTMVGKKLKCKKCRNPFYVPQLSWISPSPLQDGRIGSMLPFP